MSLHYLVKHLALFDPQKPMVRFFVHCVYSNSARRCIALLILC